MWTSATALLLVLLASGARAEAPLSAIDWLSDSVTGVATAPAPPARPSGDTPGGAITVTPLDAPDPDAVGLLAPRTTGLPRDLWAGSQTAELARLIEAAEVDTLPAIQELLQRLLLAEARPPEDSAGDGALLVARLDKLLEAGALDQAQALLERAGPTRPRLFRRWFDIALLSGREDRACAAMRATPGIAPRLPARIFCLARGGDWDAAALTLETAEALGRIEGAEATLLAGFLEPDLAGAAADLPPSPKLTPLEFRLREAIGAPLSTTGLPLAFAHADLRATAGWKARIEAAERLARTGAVAPNRLLGIYTDRRPAASGGVWDRVAAIQRFDVAVLAGDAAAVAARLPAAWAAMREVGLEVPFARLYAERLAEMPLTGPARARAFRLGLLSRRFDALARAYTPENGTERFLAGLARGEHGDAAPADPACAAVAAAFGKGELPRALASRLTDGRRGAAILMAMARISRGAEGDLSDLADGLRLLRRAGLGSTARRAALQFLILDRGA